MLGNSGIKEGKVRVYTNKHEMRYKKILEWTKKWRKDKDRKFDPKTEELASRFYLRILFGYSSRWFPSVLNLI